VDRNQSGALSLRLLTGRPAEMVALQCVLEAVRSYDAGFSVISKNKRLTLVRKLLASPA